MPNKRPNFQRIIATNDPPKVIDKPKDEEEESQLNIEKPMEPEPYFQTRTVRFNIPTTPRTPEKPHAEEEEKPYYAAHDTFSNPKKSPEEKELLKNDPFYSLRKNYARIKPGSKYAEEGIRPSSPNLPYSLLPKNLIRNNPTNPGTFFEQTTDDSNTFPHRDRYYKERPTDCINQHLIRGLSAPQPYCFIAKEAKNNYVPPEYTNSRYGAYPPWGVEETGFRTRSHYIAEPANRFGNIDMYKRPLTNQPGQIIFDHGRPNNGYYLQRHQYDNTWFGSSIKLNQQDILRDIHPKTKAEYDYIDDSHKRIVRSQSMIWPSHSEYVQMFALKSTE